jgi:hypothetical protein
MQTTDVAPPGRKAPRRPTAAQVAAVQSTLRQHQAEVIQVETEHVRALAPMLRQAQDELARALRGWVQRAPSGSLRWTAHRYRSALLQMQGVVTTLEQGMGIQLERAGRDAQKLSARHLTTEVARFSTVFGDSVPDLRFRLAAILAKADSARVPRFRSSAERYAWGRSKGVYADLKRRLAIDVLNGVAVERTIDNLQEHGGPRGLVALQGIAGEEGAVVELIPEGLFKRYRWRAELYVRTEMASAYGEQTRQGFETARAILPDLQRRWCTDGSGCPKICQPMDGQTVGPDESFIDGEGMVVDHDGGAHPNCRCRWCAWRPHWGQLLDSLGVN